MNLKRIMVASFAAFMLFSCSKEMMDSSDGPVLNPGDIQIALNIGKKSTTYATEADELAFRKNMVAYLFEADGTNAGKLVPSTMSTLTYGAASMNPTITVSSGAVANVQSTDKEVEIFLVANTAIAGTITDKASFLKARMNGFTNKIDGTTNELDLSTDGLAVCLQVDNAKLVSGSTNNAVAKVMKRAMSRVFISEKSLAEAGTPDYSTKVLAGYSVEFQNLPDGVHLSTALGSTTPDFSGVTFTGIHSYVVTGNATANRYKNQEAVAYVYPSDRNITVLVKDASTPANSRTVTFQPEANKNYNIKVITKLGAHNEIEDVTIEPINPDDEDFNIDADFNKEPVVIKTGYLGQAGFTGNADGALQIDVQYAAAAVMNESAGVAVSTEQIFGKTINDAEGGVFNISTSGSIKTKAFPSTTKAYISSDGKLAIADGKANELTFFALPNYGGDERYKIEIMGNVTKNIYTFDLVRRGLPANFTTTINGVEMMSVDATSPMVDAIILVNDINLETGANFAEKFVTFGSKNNTNIARVFGARQTTVAAASGLCPKGFRKPTTDEFHKVLGISTALIPASGAVGTSSWDPTGISGTQYGNSFASEDGKLTFKTSSLLSTSTLVGVNSRRAGHQFFYTITDDATSNAISFLAGSKYLNGVTGDDTAGNNSVFNLWKRIGTDEAKDGDFSFQLVTNVTVDLGMRCVKDAPANFTK